jgi:hypothetical protein
MALITAVFLFLVGTLGSGLSRLLTDEFKAWIPWIIQRVIRRAIVRLPPAQRERFEEEWQSHVNEVPGEIGKLTAALGFLKAARKMTLAATTGDAPLTVRRVRDSFVSALVLGYFAPLLLAICMAAFVSTGRVFTGTELVANGRKFKILQFSASGRLGKYLLRTRINEFPLLINVLRGDIPLRLVPFWWEDYGAGNWK